MKNFTPFRLILLFFAYFLIGSCVSCRSSKQLNLNYKKGSKTGLTDSQLRASNTKYYYRGQK